MPPPFTRLLVATLLALLTPLAIGPAVAWGQTAPDDAAAELAFIERLYRAGEDYRAESEALRFVHMRPRHPARPAVELARAKLYYRAGRPEESTLMLYALLDHDPPPEVALDAERLLTFAHLRRGDPQRAAETAPALGGAGTPGPSLAELRALGEPGPDAVDADAAVAWSTWLPGSGYFLLDQPGKAATALALNAALLGAVALSVENDNAPAALLFLALEAMLWQGGRSGVRQDAEAHNTRLRERRLEAWLGDHGEAQLLGVGVRWKWGGG